MRRNLPMRKTPTLEVHGLEITITTGALVGGTEYTFRGELNVWCAVDLTRKLRKALREIRDEQVRQLNHAVTHAEEPL